MPRRHSLTAVTSGLMEAAPEDLRLLIERINPDNCTFPSQADQDQAIDLQWREAIRRENDEHCKPARKADQGLNRHF